MRIAFFQRDLPSEKFGGVACQVHLLANTLVEMGESVTLFSLSPAPSDARYDVRRIRLPKRVSENRILKRFLLGLYFARVDTHEFDMIHSHGDNYLLYTQAPQVRTYYGSAFREALHAGRISYALNQWISYGLEWFGLFSADFRTAISPGTFRYLPALNAVVPCGLDGTVFSPGSKKSDCPSILFVGSLKGRKRGEMMLDIFSTVRSKIPEAELWMVVPEATEWRSEGVRFVQSPAQTELVEWYRKAWVVCVPSDYEGFGLPLIEGMACGTPVVATPSDGPRYVLENGRYGLLADRTEMPGVLYRLLKDSAFRAHWGALASERVKKYEIREIAKTYLAIYHELRRHVEL